MKQLIGRFTKIKPLGKPFSLIRLTETIGICALSQSLSTRIFTHSVAKLQHVNDQK